MLVYVRSSLVGQLCRKADQAELPQHLTNRFHQEKQLRIQVENQRRQEDKLMSISVIDERDLIEHHTELDLGHAKFAKQIMAEKTNSMKFIKEQIANELGLDAHKMQLWYYTTRCNHTSRPNTLVTTRDLAKTLWQVTHENTKLKTNTFYVRERTSSEEIICGTAEHSELDSYRLLMFKHWDRSNQRLNFIGSRVFRRNESFSDVAAYMKHLAQIPHDRDYEAVLWEEDQPKNPTDPNQPLNYVDYSEGKKIRRHGLISGDILIMESARSMQDPIRNVTNYISNLASMVTVRFQAREQHTLELLRTYLSMTDGDELNTTTDANKRNIALDARQQLRQEEYCDIILSNRMLVPEVFSVLSQLFGFTEDRIRIFVRDTTTLSYTPMATFNKEIDLPTYINYTIKDVCTRDNVIGETRPVYQIAFKLDRYSKVQRETNSIVPVIWRPNANTEQSINILVPHHTNPLSISARRGKIHDLLTSFADQIRNEPIDSPYEQKVEEDHKHETSPIPSPLQPNQLQVITTNNNKLELVLKPTHPLTDVPTRHSPTASPGGKTTHILPMSKEQIELAADDTVSQNKPKLVWFSFYYIKKSRTLRQYHKHPVFCVVTPGTTWQQLRKQIAQLTGVPEDSTASWKCSEPAQTGTETLPDDADLWAQARLYPGSYEIHIQTPAPVTKPQYGFFDRPLRIYDPDDA